MLPSYLKVVHVTPAFKNKSKTSKDKPADPLAFYLIDLKYMKDVFTTKFKLTLMISYLKISM